MESWKRKLRMGMVGGGQGAFIGGVHRIAATLDGQAELVAGCFSRDFENTKATGRQLYLDERRCYPGYAQMAEREAKLSADSRIDFVSVVTPNVSHYEIAKRFLETGFDVVCDKPMTYTLEQAEDLVKVVEKSGRVFCLTHNYTGYPLVRHARELFRSGQMGQVRRVVVEYFQDWLMTRLEDQGQRQASWRVDPAQSGIANALGDIGSHAENLLEYITGERISELCADLTTFVPGRTLDEDANVLLRLSGGGRGVIMVSQVATSEENALRIKIYGSEGGIAWDQENPNLMYVYRYGQPRQLISRGHGEYLSPAAGAVTRTPTGHPEGYLEAFANVYDGAIEAIRRRIDGRPMKSEEYAFPTVHDGLRGLRFIYKAVESARKGSVWTKV